MVLYQGVDVRQRASAPSLNEPNAQTPLVRFVVDLLYSKSTTNPQHLDMSRCFRFVMDSTTSPQQIEQVHEF
jgi:hypothetical protein